MSTLEDRVANPGRHANHSEKVRTWFRDFASSGWWHSFELPDGRVIHGAASLDSLKRRAASFPIAQDLRGKRVLDIGAWDGWFSFEMERRGAEVVAIDCVDQPSFREIHRALHSKIDYRTLDVYDLDPRELGQFDIVLFLGVLYHLKHPLLALEKVCALTTELAVVQTFVIAEGATDPGPAAFEFFETTELGGQFDNWVGPNVACVQAMCRAAGFARVELASSAENDAAVACYRHFAEPLETKHPAPRLISCVNRRNGETHFDSRRDEYVICRFASEAQDLDRDNLQARVGPFDARPALVEWDGENWAVMFKVPPGLETGWHDCRVRLVESEWSNGVPMDLA